MREISIQRHILAKKHTVVLYDSIHNLPIDQFSKMQKYHLIEAGIGKDVTGLDTHLKDAMEFISHDKKDKAIKELSNMRHLFHHILKEVDPSQLSFCCTIFSIDGKEVTDYSDDALDVLRKQLSDYGLTQKIIAEQAVKKKSTIN